MSFDHTLGPPLMKIIVAVIVMTGLTAAALYGSPQSPGNREAARPPEVKDAEIQKAVETFRAAFAKADAAAIASTFTKDAEVVDEKGEKIVGREAIVTLFADLFRESPGVAITITPESIKRLTPDAAIEEGTSTLSHPSGGPDETSRYEALYVRVDGVWLQARVREFAAPLLSHHDRLKPLEWILGDWIDEGHEAILHSSCAWTADGNYLLREFRILVKGKADVSGVQRIGWDPSAKQIKSWTFDTDGTHSEQYWAQDGEGSWIVKSSGTMPDGQKVTATNLLQRTSKDSASWTSIDKTLGVLVLPENETFLLVRKPPAPK